MFVQWQRPDAFTGSRKNCGAECRGKGGNSRFTDTGRRRSTLHNIDDDLSGRVFHPRDLEIIEIGLLSAAVLEGDFSPAGVRGSPDRGPFHLRGRPSSFQRSRAASEIIFEKLDPEALEASNHA